MDQLQQIYTEKIAKGSKKILDMAEIDSAELTKLLRKNPLQTVKQFNNLYNMKTLLIDYTKSLGNKANEDQDLQLAIMSIYNILNKLGTKVKLSKEDNQK